MAEIGTATLRVVVKFEDVDGNPLNLKALFDGVEEEIESLSQAEWERRVYGRRRTYSPDEEHADG